MKKIFKSAMLFVAASTMAFSLSSCSDSNDDNGGNSNAGAPVMKAIVVCVLLKKLIGQAKQSL